MSALVYFSFQRGNTAHFMFQNLIKPSVKFTNVRVKGQICLLTYRTAAITMID